MQDPETVGEIVAETIADAIETAQVDEQIARQTADAIAAAAMETERGQRIENVERRMDQWESQQSDQSEAISALVLGLTEVSAKLDLLTQQSSPTPTLQNVEDGQRESPAQEEPPLIVVEAQAQEPEPPVPPAPKKKRSNWI